MKSFAAKVILQLSAVNYFAKLPILDVSAVLATSLILKTLIVILFLSVLSMSKGLREVDVPYSAIQKRVCDIYH